MLKTWVRYTWRQFNHLTRFLLSCALLILLFTGGLMLTMRYLILPDIERYHDSITAMVSHVAGQPVTIGRIQADWQGMHPHLLLSDVGVLDEQGKILLALQKVDTVVSWMTALTGQLRLYSLEFIQPDLLIRRDKQGVLYIAGMRIASSIPGQPVDYVLADWLLHQKHIAVRNARITWVDEQRAAPPLILNRVNALIQNGGHRHRFSLRAQPPVELSAELDLRGEFFGASFAHFNDWQGKLYTELDYVDVVAWKAWLSLPLESTHGRGALRGWLDLEKGKVNQATADMALSDVQLQLAEGLPFADVIKLRGRVSWKDVAQGFEVSTQKLSLQMLDGQVLQPIDLYLRYSDALGKQPAAGAISVNKLDMGNFTSLSPFLPLTSVTRQRIADFAPQGMISEVQANWQGDFDKLLNYGVKARFDGLSIHPVGKIPGFARLSGHLEGNENNGILSLDARNSTVDAPLIMQEPLVVDSLIGKLSWEKHDHGMEFNFDKFTVANADLAGYFFGNFQIIPESPGLIDLTVHLTRAAVRHAARYTPLVALDGEARDWLRNALIDGKADDFNLRLKGDLNDFPFDGNRNGLFQISARASGVVVEYAKGWPRVENGDAKLEIRGKRLEVVAPTANTVNGILKNVSVVLPDMLSPNLLLQVRGEAVGETMRALDFIQKSPVRGYINGLTDRTVATGNGNLNLQVNIPLSDNSPVVVTGRYHFLDNQLSLGNKLFTVDKLNGDLLFSESSVQTQNVTGQVLGGPATIVLQSNKGGVVHARMTGRANVDALRDPDAHPWLNLLSGGFDWESEIKVVNKKTSFALTSNLAGLTSELPTPFAKRTNEIIPLRFEMNSLSEQQELLSVQYGKLLNAKFLRSGEGDERVIKRGTVKFSNAGKWVDKDGIWLTGVVPEISLEKWGRLAGATDEPGQISIAGADLLIGKASGYGYMVDDLRINARNVNGAVVALLASKSVNGEVSWHPYKNGKFSARLKNLHLKPDQDETGKTKGATIHSNVITKYIEGIKFPALDWIITNVSLNGKNLGKFELLGQQNEGDWVLERLTISNPSGALAANGKWQMTPNGEQTQLKLKLDINDAGEMLGRLGYPDAVKDGNGKLEGDFSWAGSPTDFSYAVLDGNMKLDTENGQFLQINPGLGKLLSILSLQALPKRISLDFTDVFSEGFKFDTISGEAQIRKGILSSNDFKIYGSAAKVTMKGQVDLAREMQNLRVRILPTVGNTASMLSAFVAGPAVGVGVYIANKLLSEPLDKLVSFEYHVTGSWANPNVEKTGGANPAAPKRQ